MIGSRRPSDLRRRIGRLSDPAHARRLSPPPPRRPPVERSAPRSAIEPRSRARRTGRKTPVFHTSRSFPMSSTHLATALVVPLENLRMTDVEAVGGKNASLGEMISQLRSRRARARRLRHHGPRVPRSSSPTTAWPSASRERLAALDTDDVRALAEAGAEIRALDRGAAVPAGARGRDPRASSRTLARRQSRGDASRCARRPPPKTCPTRRSPASRRPS